MLKICPLQVFLLQPCIQGPAPLHIVLPSLDYSNSDTIFALFLWLLKETKLFKITLTDTELPTETYWQISAEFQNEAESQSYQILISFEGNGSWVEERNPANTSTKGKQRGICCSAFPLSAGWSVSKCFELLCTHGTVKCLPLLLSFSTMSTYRVRDGSLSGNCKDLCKNQISLIHLSKNESK